MDRLYLSLDDVLRIHERQLSQFGGAPGVRDAGLLQSALLRPQMGYYADLIEEAAALWESLAMNHGFIDGNKRVAFMSVDIFLRLNGSRIETDQESVIAFIYHHLENHTFTKPVLEAWLRAHVIEMAL
jgi:death-on-curing protein